jgi:hypothetical protein
MNELSGCALVRAAARCATAQRCGMKQDTPRDLGVNIMKTASQKPFYGDPYTRLARAD